MNGARLPVLALFGLVVVASCASPGPGHVSGSVYVGTGYYDPWHWGPGYAPPPGAVGPPPPVHPDGRPPPHPSHPIATPPPRPSPPPRPPARPRAAPRR
jgi:hypothetical protein